MPKLTPGTQSYSAPVRRGFGHLAHLLSAVTSSPSGPVATYLTSCSPLQRKDIQAALNYMTEQHSQELAKFGFTPISAFTPPATPTSTASISADDADQDPAPDDTI